METQEKKLRCKTSEFKSDLSFNEWAQKFNVGVGYTEPIKYYQGNRGSGIEPTESVKLLNETPIERFFRVLFKRN